MSEPNAMRHDITQTIVARGDCACALNNAATRQQRRAARQVVVVNRVIAGETGQGHSACGHSRPALGGCGDREHKPKDGKR